MKSGPRPDTIHAGVPGRIRRLGLCGNTIFSIPGTGRSLCDDVRAVTARRRSWRLLRQVDMRSRSTTGARTRRAA